MAICWQALEASTWSALLKAPRAVLAGDHLQLPPVVVDAAAAQQGLGRTLFERLQNLYGGSISQMLSVQ
jgi:ATP-dependent RNA/DNA helicase IGHMBP2